MNQIPEAVTVAGLTYAVKVNDDYTQAAGLTALTNHMRLKIRIGVDSIAPQQIPLALLRELVSAVSVNYRAADYELPDPLVGSLASGLFQTLQDNPAAVAFILGGSPSFEPPLSFESLLREQHGVPPREANRNGDGPDGRPECRSLFRWPGVQGQSANLIGE